MAQEPSSERAEGSDGRRVGEVAEATGLTVRTLHHYEQVGLVVPSTRTSAGHRLYDDDDLRRLYRVRALRQLGMSLPDIGRALYDPAMTLHAAMAAQLEGLTTRMGDLGRLISRVSRLMAAVDSESTPVDDLLEVLDAMTVLEDRAQQRISILVYDDLEAAYRFLVDVFGLGSGELVRDGEGNPVHGELHVGDGVVWLHPVSEQFGLSSPRRLGGATATMAVLVDDVDAHYRETSARGADIVYEPCDQPYGYREYSARDSEGGLWSFMKPLS